MKRFILFYIILFMAGSGLTQSKLLLVGDSITEGYGSQNGLGFRDDLSNSLLGGNISFLYVGPKGVNPYWGHYYAGSLIGDFYHGPGGFGSLDVGSTMDYHLPEIILIHLGTNGIEGLGAFGLYSHDGGQTLRADNLPGRLANLIAYLIKWRDGSRGTCLKHILISQIVDKPAYRANIEAFNAQVAQMYSDSNNGQVPLIPPGVLRLVDHYTTFDAGTMFSADSIHPNDTGYRNMADRYFEAMRTLPMQIEHYSPAFVSGVMRETTPELLTVKITDDYGESVFGAKVWFEVVSGEASISSSSTVITDTEGLASVEIVAIQAGISVIRTHSQCLRDSVVDFTVNAERSISVDGIITYHHNGLPVDDVSIEWAEENVFIDTTNTDGEFIYQLFPPQSNITLLPFKQRAVGGDPGVLMYDAAITARDVVGIQELSSSGAHTADVNGDAQVTMLDAALIARYSVGLANDFQSKAGRWSFSPDSVYFPQLDNDVPGHEFTGFLFGDVSASWSAQSMPKTINMDYITAEVDESDTSVTVDIIIDRHDFISLNMVCKFDQEMLRFKKSDSDFPGEFQIFENRESPGLLKIGMFGSNEKNLSNERVLSLTFQAKGEETFNNILIENIYVNDNYMEDIQIDIMMHNDFGADMSPVLIQNYPNPFNNSTVVMYNVEKRGYVEVSIYNNIGQLVKQLAAKEHESGEFKVNWDCRDIQGREIGSGVYFCVMISATGKKYVNKMELLR